MPRIPFVDYIVEIFVSTTLWKIVVCIAAIMHLNAIGGRRILLYSMHVRFSLSCSITVLWSPKANSFTDAHEYWLSLRRRSHMRLGESSHMSRVAKIK